MNIHNSLSVGPSQELISHMYRIPIKSGYIRADRSSTHCCDVYVACAIASSLPHPSFQITLELVSDGGSFLLKLYLYILTFTR